MQSMTGYGRYLLCRDGRELLMEIKSVNHRFLDVSFRLPKALMFLEDALRTDISASGLCRGHVDVFVTYQNNRADARFIHVDLPLLKACGEACLKAQQYAGDARGVTVAEMLSLCGALTITQSEEDIQAVTELAREAFEEACIRLMDMRRREGEALKDDLSQHLDKLQELAQGIASHAPEAPVCYRERLLARLAEWEVTTVDPQRVAQEVAMMADRCTIDEELARLESHMAQFREGLLMGGETGRKLDFLLQEMNREINTIGAKASNAIIARMVVDAKCVVEKLREQAQNIV